MRSAGGRSAVSSVTAAAVTILVVLKSAIAHSADQLLKPRLVKERLDTGPIVPFKVPVFVAVQEPIIDGKNLRKIEGVGHHSQLTKIRELVHVLSAH